MRMLLIIFNAIVAGYCAATGLVAYHNGDINWAATDIGLAIFNFSMVIFNSAAYIKDKD